MKKLVDYDDSDGEGKGGESKVEQSSSNIASANPGKKVIKRLDYGKLPVNLLDKITQLKSEAGNWAPEKVDFSKKIHSLDRSDEPLVKKQKTLDDDKEMTLSQPKRTRNLMGSIKTSYAGPAVSESTGSGNVFYNKATGKSFVINKTNEDEDENPGDDSVDQDITVKKLVNPAIVEAKAEHEESMRNMHKVSEEEMESFKKLSSSKRNEFDDPNLNVMDISGKELLDFDWKSHHERQMAKKEFLKKHRLNEPTKLQKSKHQLSYLAQDLILNHDEMVDKHENFKDNRQKTRAKYGWQFLYD